VNFSTKGEAVAHAKIMDYSTILDVDCLHRIAAHFTTEITFYITLLHLSRAHFSLATYALGQMKSLCLNSYRKSICDHHLKALLLKCKALQEIDVTWCCNLTIESLYRILDFRDQLLSLTMSFCHGINSELAGPFLQAFTQLHTLRVCCFSRIDGTDFMEVAAHCPHLQAVDFSKCDGLRDDAVIFLSEQCPFLHTVVLSLCEFITNDAINSLNALQLRCLKLNSCTQITSLPASHFPALRVLHLARTQISDAAIKTLRCPNLDNFDVSHCDVTDGAIESLASVSTRLRFIKLSYCKFLGADAFMALAKYCPDLVEVDFRSQNYTNPTLLNALVYLLNNCKLSVFTISELRWINMKFIEKHLHRPGRVLSRGPRGLSCECEDQGCHCWQALR